MPMMRAGILTNYTRVAGELGLNPAALLQQVGLNASQLEAPDRLISGDAVVRLLELSASSSGCPAFGLRLAQVRQLSEFGVTGLLLTQQRTIRDALRIAQQYMHLLNEAAVLHVDESAERVIVRVDLLTDIAQPNAQAVELYLFASVQLFRSIAGNHWRPQSMHFRRPPPHSQEEHHRLFQCRCEFASAFNGITLAPADLDRVNPTADPAMAGYARHLIDLLPGSNPASTLAELKRHLHIFLPMGRATLTQLALARQCSVRQLQRQLEDAGESFSGLLCGIRRDLVLQYLANPRLEIGQVAGLLGFSRHASFTRWFIQQFACTPLHWRRQTTVLINRGRPVESGDDQPLT
ncbi:AraC family transcriptional regulator [Pseudomonas sp. N040]|uniref:AraC family transcriptional regulator n=1 Tax=Pseudomonas sp. N040 TaxID=2785325 RepID=UPI0018A2C32E|nr:AraC family transcriptional regulator [Pseudomonas sp. N040]MBF7731167.1 AraC family transcriptional regulator ligand-binding domain-containing protein [Pseudomonas sp. N040]MBW7014810.1 AraC family transcriptional regulator ligand-binding domain-containing protein [Pseudomonas sp. N040]